MGEVMKEMPRYQSHKKVWALRIQSIEPGMNSKQEDIGIITPHEQGYAPFEVSGEYMQKHKPVAGGYFVMYEGGYKSFSPAEAFEGGNKPIVQGKFSFGEALVHVENGGLISREGWNGKGMFVFMRPQDDLTIDMIVHKVKSLPATVKEHFDNSEMLSDDKVKFTAYLCMKAADGSIVNGWLASQTDMLAKDWYLF